MIHRRLLPQISFPRPRWGISSILSFTIVACFLVALLSGGITTVINNQMSLREGLQPFALERSGYLAGRYWQIFTHSFLHGGWSHLAFNAFCIYYFGSRLEHIFSMVVVGKAVLYSLVLGSLAHLILAPQHPLGLASAAHPPLIGASAIAMGLLVAYISLVSDTKLWPIMISGRNLRRGILISSICLYLCTPGLNIPYLSEVGNWAVSRKWGNIFMVGHIYHLGGAFGGWLAMHPFLKKSLTSKELKAQRLKKEKKQPE